MSLNIKNPVTVALVNERARRQGISKTAAIHQALSERQHRMGYGDTAQQRLLAETGAYRRPDPPGSGNLRTRSAHGPGEPPR